MTPLLSFLIALTVNAAFFAIVLPFAGGHEPVQLTASLLVLIWAARLGGYLNDAVDARLPAEFAQAVAYGRMELNALFGPPLEVRFKDSKLLLRIRRLA